jgi:hypothetical protein
MGPQFILKNLSLGRLKTHFMQTAKVALISRRLLPAIIIQPTKTHIKGAKAKLPTPLKN